MYLGAILLFYILFFCVVENENKTKQIHANYCSDSEKKHLVILIRQIHKIKYILLLQKADVIFSYIYFLDIFAY